MRGAERAGSAALQGDMVDRCGLAQGELTPILIFVGLRQAFARFALGAVLGVTLSFALPLAVHGCAPAPAIVVVKEPSPAPDAAPKPPAGALLRPVTCPEEMSLVEDAFCIDRWEASLVEVTSRGEKPYSPFETVRDKQVRAVSKPGVYPQAYVSRYDAEQACAASGKRLCRASEWIYACKGGEEQKFPYGRARKPGVCNDGARVSPLKSLFGHLGARMFAYRRMNDSRLNQVPGTLAKAGAHESCTNRFGVFDMVGNLHEWVDEPEGTFRGGYYLDTRINGDGCEYRTVAHGPGYHDYSTGFRCCADPL